MVFYFSTQIKWNAFISFASNSEWLKLSFCKLIELHCSKQMNGGTSAFLLPCGCKSTIVNSNLGCTTQIINQMISN